MAFSSTSASLSVVSAMGLSRVLLEALAVAASF